MEGEQMTWAQSVDAMFTDGIVILHRGSVVYETYRGALTPELPHIAFSMTKSFVGLLAGVLAHEGAIDPAAPVAHYIPELEGSAFADATVRQVMDMTVGVKYSEVYTDPAAEVRTYGIAAGYGKPPEGYDGPRSIVDFLRTLKKQGEHGAAFAYKTCNTEVLAWIVQRVTGKPMAQLISERIWQKIGAEEDANIIVDPVGMAACGGGMSLALRDLARFGEMMRNGGTFNGQEIVPGSRGGRYRARGEAGGFREGGIHDDAGLELSRPVVGEPQQSRRLYRARHSWPGVLDRADGRAGYCAVRLASGCGERQFGFGQGVPARLRGDGGASHARVIKPIPPLAFHCGLARVRANKSKRRSGDYRHDDRQPVFAEGARGACDRRIARDRQDDRAGIRGERGEDLHLRAQGRCV
jgi:CubicO group peptidase (beta-lactamase class C family)